MTERAVAAVGRGFNTIYYKVGIDEERDVELVLRTREAIGPGPASGSSQRGVEPFDGDPHPLKNAACFPRICRTARAYARHCRARPCPQAQRRSGRRQSECLGPPRNPGHHPPRSRRRDNDRSSPGRGADGDEKDSRHVRSRGARFRQSRLQCHDREHDQPHACHGDVIGLHPGAAGPSRLSRGRLRDRAN